jgi:hypothetical protein
MPHQSLPMGTVPLTESQLAELGKALHRHLIVLDAMLRSDDRWVLDLHIPIATQLRVLLCDADFPMLLTYAKDRDITLRVWGPRPPGSGLTTKLLFGWNALVASWQPVSAGFEMSIEEYLDTGVAVTTLPGEQAGRAYSPRQIIKWVANKEGGAHFSFDKPATLEVLKQSAWSSGDRVNPLLS